MEQLKLGQVLPLPCFNYSAEGQPLGKARQQDVQSPVVRSQGVNTGKPALGAREVILDGHDSDGGWAWGVIIRLPEPSIFIIIL